MTKQLNRAEADAMKHTIQEWLSTIPDGYVPVAAGGVPGAPTVAVCANADGTSMLTVLGAGLRRENGPLSAAVTYAAAVHARQMAGQVWHKAIATLPQTARRAFNVLTVRFEDGMDPEVGALLARKLLGEGAPSDA
ncbi:hypothetical protein KSP35_01875 [Aquihabitans sp. G128]|uniref:hypothetical protein n=1 Tax=Aquihabitans sp. G128 TaxID=2849779 RepID=UPI001C229218|nr:hypothetical protein [Aquihabitans sp. G128]QXC61622.1 hypothetical protein KSP35_01875 [Aquihabitans sp. G128]